MECWVTLGGFQKVMGGAWSRYIQNQVDLLNVPFPYPHNPAFQFPLQVQILISAFDIPARNTTKEASAVFS